MAVQSPQQVLFDNSWQILLIDDDEDDFILIRDMLKEAKGRRIELYWAATYEVGQTKLAENNYDAVLVDNDLGARTGIELIRAASDQGFTAPMILFTGRGSYEVDVEAMQAGATVYLSKNELNALSLERFIRYAIERKRADTSLKESEEKFSKAFRASPAAQLITRLSDGVIVDVNESYEKLLGYLREELIGHKTTELNIYLNPQERDRILEIMKKEGRVYNQEMALRSKTGSLVSILGSLETINIGSENYLLSTLIDITERKQAEASLRESEAHLRESEQRFRLALRNAPVSVAAQDCDLRYIWAFHQRSAEPNQIIGHFDHEIFTPEEAAHFTEIKRRVLTEGIEQREQLWVDRPAGRMYLDICWEPILDNAGNIAGVASATVDLTPGKLAENALRESEARMREFLENTHDTYFALDHEWRFTYANRKFSELMSIDPPEMIGKNFWDLFPRYLGTDVEQNYRKVMEERVPIHFRRGGVYTNSLYDLSLYPTREGLASFAIDRTEELRHQQQLEEERARLRDSEQKYRSLFENSVEAVFLTYPDGSIEAANPAACAMFGWSEQEIRRLGRSGILDTEDPRLAEAIEIRKRDGRIQAREYTAIRKGGERFPIEVDSVILPGAPQRSFVILRDITERKRAEKTLREGEERERNRVQELTAILDAVPAYIWITHDPDSRYMTGNRATHELLRSQPGDNLSRSAPEQEYPRQFRAMRNGQEIPPGELPVQLAAGKCIHVEDYEFDIVFEDGSSRRLMGNAAPLCDELGNPAGAVGAFIDITDQRRIEHETRERIALMEVQRRLLEHREMERSQLARDLHDGPIQSLGGLGFSLQILQSTVENQGARDMIEQMKLDVRDLVGELRGVCNELRPPLLERFGFRKAVQAHVDDFRERHPEIKLDLEMTENPIKLPENIATALFRIYQEALNNIVHHSEATEISIHFDFDPQQIHLEIQDNGKGLPLKIDWIDLVRQGHFGLVGMKERTEAVGGSLRIDTLPEKGTTIQVIVPLTN